MRYRQYLNALAYLTVLVCFSGCGGSKNNEDNGSPTASIGKKTDTDDNPANLTNNILPEPSPPPPKVKENLFPVVDIETNLGTIRVKLNAEKAPMTVDNFLLNYVDRKFYNGTVFHYVEKDFIAIAGGYATDLKAKPVRSQIRNEAGNGLKNKRGSIAMSRHPDYINSATSQFFFNLSDNDSLDYRESEDEKDEEKDYGYCVFGEVIQGIEVVDKIAKIGTKAKANFPFNPAKPIVIKSVTRVPEEKTKK